MSTPALFLDRDGVINIDHAYVFRAADFEFIDGIFDLVLAAKKSGYLVIIVTNQAGIGRGYYTEADFHRLMDWVGSQFVSRGSHIDGVYFCPDHPEHGVGAYRKDSAFRKPGPGMLLQAAADHDIDLTNSIMVGDKVSDVEAGRAAGVCKLFCFNCNDHPQFATAISHLSEVLPHLTPNTRTGSSAA